MVGYSPKRFATVVPFQNLLTRMRVAPEDRSLTLAPTLGFSIAHLSRDVARLAHPTPGHLLSRQMADWSAGQSVACSSMTLHPSTQYDDSFNISSRK